MPSPRYWREVPSRFRLEAARCHACDKVSFPARRICPACRGTEFEKIKLTREGRVVTSTVLYVAPNEFAMETPYAVAIVETPEGARLMAQLVDCEPADVKPGLSVALEFRLIRQEGHGGILCYGHKAVPAGV
ncbi:MAG: Zn-ribbon domain-containing OB-fold protein [Gemmatimonadota bacterium]